MLIELTPHRANAGLGDTFSATGESVADSYVKGMLQQLGPALGTRISPRETERLISVIPEIRDTNHMKQEG